METCYNVTDLLLFVLPEECLDSIREALKDVKPDMARRSIELLNLDWQRWRDLNGEVIHNITEEHFQKNWTVGRTAVRNLFWSKRIGYRIKNLQAR